MRRSKTSGKWMREHVSDPFVRRAQQEGYRSRAAFKLLEILQKDRLLRPGMLVVDLGAAPGGWSQVVAPLVAPAGRVIALDLLEMAPIPGVDFIRGDFRENEVAAELARLMGGREADLVLSDMSPNISGIAVTDQSRSMHLAELALEFAADHLKPGGCLLVKVFQAAGTEALRRAFGEVFDAVVVRKPRASRDRSSEFYLLGRGRKAAR
jgi:23S rRNA (uridine2552-2'-O)-methyltransferase